jgi:hypothetical protein
MLLVALVLGVVASTLTAVLTLPPSRELVIKLGTLVEMARRANPDRFAAQLAAISPFVDGAFKHNRVTGMLRADFSGFGEVCERLQREAKRLDRRAHIGMLPMLAYMAVIGLWFLWRHAHAS